MEWILEMMKLVSMILCVTLRMERVPSEIIGGIGGRLKALLCKAHCG